MLWNQFSNEAKLAESVLSFKKLIREWLGLDKMHIFIKVNFDLFYYYHYYYCYYLLLLLLLLMLLLLLLLLLLLSSSLLYTPVLKSNNSRNRETYHAGYYVDKGRHTKTVISLIFDVVIRLEFS